MDSESMGKNIPEESQIVVIGGGGSGLAAAVTIAERGGNVTVMEKRKVFGGNTNMASVLFGAETHVQKRMNIEVTKDWAFKEAMGYAHWKINPRLVRAFINRTDDSVQWMEKNGIEFVDFPKYFPFQRPRVFHFMNGHGAALIRMMVDKGREMGVEFLTETGAEKIIRDGEGRIKAVLASDGRKSFEVPARCVIIATGGYAANKEMMKKYCQDYSEDIVQFGLPINYGDGYRMAMEMGAAEEGLGLIHLIGPRTIGSPYVAAIVVEPNTIWLNKKGERFVDESLSLFWPEAANALARQPDRICYNLFDEKIKKIFMEEGIIRGWKAYNTGTKMTKLGEEIEETRKLGEIKISESLEEIEEWMGLERDRLKTTVKKYNEDCDKGYDSAFAKDTKFLLPIKRPPYYALKCHQGFHGTVGGIKINHNMEVVDKQDEPIPGLYAVGNDTGGWEGDTYCLVLSGSTFAFAINSGRIAGEKALEYVRS